MLLENSSKGSSAGGRVPAIGRPHCVCKDHNAKLEQYSKLIKASRVISSILVANNGIAAVKAIRSIRKWSYESVGCDRAVRFICMATPEDLANNSEHIRLADHYEEVPGGSNNYNYANVDLIVNIAEHCAVDAVWAGWGHASEDPRLPHLLKKRGIVFIGPPSHAMSALGDKVASTIIAQTAGVPVLPWSGKNLMLDHNTIFDIKDLGESKSNSSLRHAIVPEELYAAACVTSLEDAMLVASDRVGYPLMLKASGGGGGRGIRRVDSATNFAKAYNQVCAEVPGSPVFLMRLAENARHLEVQIIADEHGSVASLWGRDCSVQRRHQKIVEEAPATIAPDAVFENMERCAISLAKMVGYANAGTVEFLYLPTTKQFYFLELNPRLQVEHPTTEFLTGVNIPAVQVMVAMGAPLQCVPSICSFYGVSEHCYTSADCLNDSLVKQEKEHQSVFDKAFATRPRPRGHVIACRITAENPDAGFLPSGGQVVQLNFQSSKDVWGYFSVSASGGLHEFADSQFGHVFAFGVTRENARSNMIMALKELSIRGDFQTTVEFLINLLETQEFAENTFSTSWLDGLISDNVKLPNSRVNRDAWPYVVCGAAMQAFEQAELQLSDFLRCFGKGNVPAQSSIAHVFDVCFLIENTKFRVRVTLVGREQFLLELNGSTALVHTRKLNDGSVLIRNNNHTFTAHLYKDAASTGSRLTINGCTVLLEQETDPSRIVSPNWGKIISWLVPDLSHVQQGKVIAEIESMKYVMPVCAPADGRIYQLRPPGTRLAPGDLFGKLEPSSETAKLLGMQNAITCDAVFPDEYATPPLSKLLQSSLDCHGLLRRSQPYFELRSYLENLIAGFPIIHPVSDVLDGYIAVHSRAELPNVLFTERLSAFHGRLPACEQQLREILANSFSTDFDDNLDAFPAREILSLLRKEPNQEFVGALTEIAEAFEPGQSCFVLDQIVNLLQRFKSTEAVFTSAHKQTRTVEKCLLELRGAKDNNEIFWLYFAYARTAERANVIISLIERVIARNIVFGRLPNSYKLFNSLSTIAEYDAPSYPTRLCVLARSVLLELQRPTFFELYSSFKNILQNASLIEAPSCLPKDPQTSKVTEVDFSLLNTRAAALREITHSAYTVFRTLQVFLIHNSNSLLLSETALEAYVRRSYLAYHLLGTRTVKTWENPHVPVIEWRFKLQSLTKSDEPTTSGRGFVRIGFMAALRTLDELAETLPAILRLFSPVVVNAPGTGDMNVLNIALTDVAGTLCQMNEALASDAISQVLQRFSKELQSMFVRRVTVLVVSPDAILAAGNPEYYNEISSPLIFTFRDHSVLPFQAFDSSCFVEDQLIRHLEPAHAFNLELQRLSNYQITPIKATSKAIYLYYAQGKVNHTDARIFVRTLVRTEKLVSATPVADYLTAHADTVLNGILDSLEIARARYPLTDCNHLFMSIVSGAWVPPERVMESFSGFISRHGVRLWRLRVSSAEVRFSVAMVEDDTSIQDEVADAHHSNQMLAPSCWRFVISNFSGVLRMEAYRETLDDHGETILVSMWEESLGRGSLHLQKAHTAYPVKEKIQPRRHRAHEIGTVYVYDIIDLLAKAVEQQWKKCYGPNASSVSSAFSLLQAKEIILDVKSKTTCAAQNNLSKDFARGVAQSVVLVDREPGKNDCGVVAWEIDMRTPEAPNGRKIILIANDITHSFGSFGPEEDALFFAASRYARRHGIPRVFVAANSGARIGLAQEVLDVFQVSWKNEHNRSLGVDYLYIDEKDYQAVCNSVNVEKVPGTSRYRIIDVIGESKAGLGVECLQGSAAIASETSAAYNDIFTASLVIGRTVGIGAYLVRLGQRTVQCEGQPIILTGTQALNKVLGRNVYTSNLQLGGPHIMKLNGISHLTAPDALTSFCLLINWLSYVPVSKNAALPILKCPVLADTEARDVVFVPQGRNSAYDPRHLIEGRETPLKNGSIWEPGLFDRGSFMEVMATWSPSVVVGRARLTGIPVGVVAVETRPVTTTIPADPANPDSTESQVPEAPGVWTTASAYKTAQAIRDIQREGLPLLVLANWRGFSGGPQDMYEGVLKSGSWIVDALREYTTAPVFVYIVPHGELRGGAWVVLDSAIQPSSMEMYADETARGGVLEPEGVVEIKFRRAQKRATASRLAKQALLCIRPTSPPPARIVSLPSLSTLQSTPPPTLLRSRTRTSSQATATTGSPTIPLLDAAVTIEEEHMDLVALAFAELHDTPGRMLAKKAIRKVVKWRDSRRFFAARLRRLLAEREVLSEVRAQAKNIFDDDVCTFICNLYYHENEGAESNSFDTNDAGVAEWISTSKRRIVESFIQSN